MLLLYQALFKTAKDVLILVFGTPAVLAVALLYNATK